MKVKTITTATNLDHPGFLQFKKSLDKFGWECEIAGTDYKAFGSKMVNAYNYAKKADCSHLFILDSYDIVVLDRIENVISKIAETYDFLDCVLFNAEKACWPYDQWKLLYPEVNSDWKYLNGGAAFVEVNNFIQMFEENPIKHEDNDQVNLAKIYLTSRDRYSMRLDTECNIFQSVAFEETGEFEYKNNRVFNTKTKTYPSIVHGNGHTNMDKVYRLL